MKRIYAGIAALSILSTGAIASFATLAHAQDEGLSQKAQIACIKIGNTRNMDALDRTNILIDFGFTNPTTLELAQRLVELGFETGRNNCVEILLSVCRGDTC